MEPSFVHQLTGTIAIRLHFCNRIPIAKRQRTVVQRQIEATDREIDRLVYELYDLTEDEIKIVEDATS